MVLLTSGWSTNENPKCWEKNQAFWNYLSFFSLVMHRALCYSSYSMFCYHLFLLTGFPDLCKHVFQWTFFFFPTYCIYGKHAPKILFKGHCIVPGQELYLAIVGNMQIKKEPTYFISLSFIAKACVYIEAVYQEANFNHPGMYRQIFLSSCMSSNWLLPQYNLPALLIETVA